VVSVSISRSSSSWRSLEPACGLNDLFILATARPQYCLILFNSFTFYYIVLYYFFSTLLPHAREPEV
jgi:hypothetical protein